MLDTETIINDLIHELGRYPEGDEVEAERRSRIEVLEAAANEAEARHEAQLNDLTWNGDY